MKSGIPLKLIWTSLILTAVLYSCANDPASPSGTSDVGVSGDVGITDILVVQELDASDLSIPDATVVDASIERACNAAFTIVTPKQSDLVFGGALMVSGSVQEMLPIGLPDLVIHARDRNGTILGTGELTDDGTYAFSLATMANQSGLTTLVIGATVDGETCLESTQVDFRICKLRFRDDFTTLSPDWTQRQSAYWDENGWLELTGVARDRTGSAFNGAEVISRGIASFRITVATGDGYGTGADGLAFSIADFDSLERLEAMLSAGQYGSGLGYGVAGPYAEGDFVLEESMITVEIDTYYNREAGSGTHQDPTESSHIAITANGDPSNHLAWFEVPDVEDLRPHSLRVDILPDSIAVYFDDVFAVEAPGSFIFKGGYMFMTASTGSYSNYHRIDDITILHECQ